MTDNEYAIRLYCYVLHREDDQGDAYCRGILDRVENILNERERAALEAHIRHGKTYAQISRDMGVSAQTVGNAVKKAHSKLHNPYNLRYISVKALRDHLNQQIKEAKAEIERLYTQIEKLIQGEPIAPSIEFALDSRKEMLDELGFTTRTYNYLLHGWFRTVESLLAAENLDRLEKMRGFGEKSRNEVLTVMREHGHGAWADAMEQAKKASVRNDRC